MYSFSERFDSVRYKGEFLPHALSEGRSHISEAMRTAVISRGSKAMETDLPAITPEDYSEFSRNGNRSRFEQKYFLRRHVLNDLAAAEYIEATGRFVPRIKEIVGLILDEPGWQLPAHNSYHRGEPVLPLPDPARPVLDLFACETGSQLAMIAYLSDDPEMIGRLNDALDRRIVRPFISEHFWWMGNGDEAMCNWTPWCIQNVLLTAFLPHSYTLSEQDALTIIRKSCYALDCFIKDYGEDGCCNEGPHYFRHAGLCLDTCISILNEVTGNAFSDAFRDPMLINMSAYIMHMHACGRYYFNYADSAAVIPPAGVREYFFGLRTGRSDVCDFALRGLTVAMKDSYDRLFEDESVQLNLWYRLLTVTTADSLPSGASAVSCPASSYEPFWYPSVGIFTAHGGRCDLAVKAGCNDDSHNHNDVGSLILYRDGKPLLVDIGVETYTARTFSSDRYSIWTMQSCYHNTPTLCGTDQSAGAQYRAGDVSVCLTGDTVSITMDIAPAYELGACGAASCFYRRTVALDRRSGRVTLTDNTDIPDVILNFIAYEHIPEIEALEGQGFTVTCEVLEIKDPRLKTSWDHDLLRYRVRTSGRQLFTLVF